MASLNDLVPAGVVTGDDLMTLMEHARANSYALPAVNCTRYVIDLRTSPYWQHNGHFNCLAVSTVPCCERILYVDIMKWTAIMSLISCL